MHTKSVETLVLKSDSFLFSFYGLLTGFCPLLWSRGKYDFSCAKTVRIAAVRADSRKTYWELGDKKEKAKNTSFCYV